MAEVLSRERRLRDRNTQLLIPGKSFKRVLDFLQHAQVGITAQLPFGCSREGLVVDRRCAMGTERLQRVVQAIPDAPSHQRSPLARA